MGSNSKMPRIARRRYRVIAVSLYEEEAVEADRITEILRESGWPKANRSLVIREALLRLEDELSGKSSEDVFRYFVDRYARRAGQLPSSRAASNRPRDDRND